MSVIRRTTWRCPDCGWAYSYDEPMTDVFCVRCFEAGRGNDIRCEEMVPASDSRGAVGALERLANPTHRPRSEEAALLQAEVVQIAQATLDALGGQ